MNTLVNSLCQQRTFSDLLGSSPAAWSLTGWRNWSAPTIPLAELQSLTRHGPRAAGRFDAAAADRDVTAMVTAILELEQAVSDWAADTEEDQGTAQSRAVLRSLIGRLGNIAAADRTPMTVRRSQRGQLKP